MKRPLLVLFVTVLLDLVGFGIVIPLLTFYAEDYGASPMQVTLLMACYSIAQFLFSPMWGALSDRHGRRPILLLSIGMGTLMLAGFAWSRALWLLFVFRTLHGLFAANISTAQACMADLLPPEDRARGMGLIGAAFGLGFTLGPWIGGEMSVHGLAAPIWLAAGLSALNLLLALAFLPETLEPGIARHRAARPMHPAALARVLSNPRVGTAIALTFVMTASFSMMEATFALFEEHRFGLDAREVGRMLGFIGLVMMVVQGGLVGRLARRVGEGTLVRAGVPGMALALAALVFAGPTFPLLAVCGALAVFQGLAQPSLFALISRRTAASEQGFVMGANQSLSALARAVAPGVAGLLFSRVAMQASFLGAALVLALGIPLALAATRSPAPAASP